MNLVNKIRKKDNSININIKKIFIENMFYGHVNAMLDIQIEDKEKAQMKFSSVKEFLKKYNYDPEKCNKFILELLKDFAEIERIYKILKRNNEIEIKKLQFQIIKDINEISEKK